MHIVAGAAEGAAAPGRPGAARISRTSSAAAGTACGEREEGEITRGEASRHILILPPSRTPRAPGSEPTRGLAIRGSLTFLGWGEGMGQPGPSKR